MEPRQGKRNILLSLAGAVMIVFVATSGLVGFRLGRNAAASAGALVDTIVLSPDQSLAQGRAEITHFLSGRLLKTGGDPCDDATVRLLESGKSDATDARGKFFFSDVRTGAHTMEVVDGDGTLLGRTTLTLTFEAGAVPAAEQNSLTLPQDVRMVEVTFTLDAEQQSLSLDENASCAVTSEGTVVNFSGQALSLSAGSTVVVPGGDIVTDGGYVLLPSKAVAITPWGGRQDLTPTGADGTSSSKETNAINSQPPESSNTESKTESRIEEMPESSGTESRTEEPPESSGTESKTESRIEEMPESSGTESRTEEPPESSNTESKTESRVEQQPEDGEPSGGTESELPTESTPEEQPGDDAASGVPGVSMDEDGDVTLDNGAQIAPDGTVTVPDEEPVDPSDDVVVIPPEGPAEVLPELPEVYEPTPDAPAQPAEPTETAPPANGTLDGSAEADGDAQTDEDGEPEEEPTPEPTPTPNPDPVSVSWSQQSMIDLFANAQHREGDFGTAKVRDPSTGEEKVVPIIAPGSSGYYDFSLKNDADYNIRFTLSISEGSFHLPILYSVRDLETNYVYQGDSKVNTDLSPITSGYINLPPHSERRYRLGWKWQMDDWLAPWWDDEIDTEAAAREDRTYMVSVGIQAEQVYSATAKK